MQAAVSPAAIPPAAKIPDAPDNEVEPPLGMAAADVPPLDIVGAVPFGFDVLDAACVPPSIVPRRSYIARCGVRRPSLEHIDPMRRNDQ